MANNEITDASELFISINNELRPWSDVSQDIISYLKTKVEGLSQSLIYKGSVTNFSDLEAIQDKSVGDMWNVVNENNANYAWNGFEWDSLGPMNITIDVEAIEDSPNAIKSGFVFNALMNYAEYSDVQAIINEVFGEQSIADITRNVSQQISDMTQDISDIQGRLNDIPDPLISLDMNNAVVNGTDNGLFVDDKSSTITQIQNTMDSINQRVTSLEENSNVESISEIYTLADNSAQITISSDNVLYYKISGDVTFEFTPSEEETAFSTKYLYLETVGDANLTIENADWSMIYEGPTFYSAGYYLLAKLIWIGGKVIIETIDVNQMPDALLDEITYPSEPNEPEPVEP